MSQDLVTLLSDYGPCDEFAGVLRGVVLGICPRCQVIDITHGIERYCVRQGAIVLQNAIGYMPVGVHLAVVDPGVGTKRRAVCVRTGDYRVLVGPDNGLLSLAWQSCGGAVEAFDVSSSPHRLEPVQATFHGRDIFAPIAAHAARGTALAQLGTRLDPSELKALELPKARVARGILSCKTLYFDRFGNAVLAAEAKDAHDAGLSFGDAVAVTVGGGSHSAVFGHTFADAQQGELVVYEDSSRRLSLALNGGNARAALCLGPDADISIRAR